MSQPSSAVLLLAYGSPDKAEDVEAYFTHIRGGRTPSRESVQNLRERYETVGGKTPLRKITESAGKLLQAELNARGRDLPVFVGMKHWHPYIADTVERMLALGITNVVAVALAPHFSRMSIGAYREAVLKAANGSPLNVMFVEQWHDHPGFIDLIANRITDALRQFALDGGEQVEVIFSAHSLPERIRSWDDPYERQLQESCQLVAERAGLANWHFAWQSAGQTGEPWLGPDLGEYLEVLSGKGVRNVLSVPIGFVAEHLEVLYDIDIEAQERARSLGISLMRTQMPNATPDFVSLLADIAVSAEARGGIPAAK